MNVSTRILLGTRRATLPVVAVLVVHLLTSQPAVADGGAVLCSHGDPLAVHGAPGADPLEAGGGNLEFLLHNPPWPDGTQHLLVQSSGFLTADDFIFAESAAIVAVRFFYGADAFTKDPNNPGSDFFLRVWEDDGTGTRPAETPIFISGPHNPGDGILQIDLFDTDGFGADSLLGATFNFGSEFFVADAETKYWTGMTGTPPPSAECLGVTTSNTPATSFEPMVQSTADGWEPVFVGFDPKLPTDMGMSLFGPDAGGGTTVLTLSGQSEADCTVRVTPTTAFISECDGGKCDSDPLYGADCYSEATLPAGLEPSEMAAALAIQFAQLPGHCNDAIGAEAAGPYVIVTTTEGRKPRLCVSIDGVPIGLAGGVNHCEVDGCGYHFEVGHGDCKVPLIAEGVDHFATPPTDCDLNIAGEAGTWVEVVAAGALFDQDGLPPAGDVDLRIRLTGVARDFAADDSDMAVRRTDAFTFGRCSGDFSSSDGPPGVYAPDGVVDAFDILAFDWCNGQTEPFAKDCGFFDYDGDDAIDGDDRFVLQCLGLSGSSSECCPCNTDLPQHADTAVPTTLTRMHLRGCAYFEITRDDVLWPENWVVDYYVSDHEPSAGADEVGDCEEGDDEGSDGNNVIATANDLGLLAEGFPRQIGGINGNWAGCDIAPFWPQDHDADVYRFTLGADANVLLRADGIANVDCPCNAGSNGIISLWLYDTQGRLLGHDDPIGAADPVLQLSLSSGEYYVLIASAGQIQPPHPNGIPGDPFCSIAFAPEVDGGGSDPTGCYDLHLAVLPRSEIRIVQETPSGGSFDARLLVQPLITFQKVADPFRAVLIDTGDIGTDAIVLEASGHYVTDLDAGLGIIPGDAGFVPGVRDDGGIQTVEPIQYEDPASNQTAHRVTPARERPCETIFDGCAYAQAPDAEQALPAVGAVFSSMVYYPLADDFEVKSGTDIESVTFWVTPAGLVSRDDEFVVRIVGDTIGDPGEPCNSMPDGINLISEGTMGDPVIAAELGDVDRVSVDLAEPFTAQPGVTYWLELALVSDAPTDDRVSFVMSTEGDGSFFHDVVPHASGQGDCDALFDGDGWDCNVVADDSATPDCDETDPDGDRRTDGNIAFCVGARARPAYVDLPGDVGVGTWRIAPGEIVWAQPFAVRNDGVAGFVSDFASGTSGGDQAADRFTFFESATVTDVHWRGLYTANTPDPAGDEFTLEFWSDGDDVPDQMLRLFTPPNSEIDRTSGELTGDPGQQVFSYTYQLPAVPAFEVNANQTIWLSVINNTISQEYNWRLATGGAGNSDGQAAVRVGLANAPPWEAIPGQGEPPTDFSFDITVAGNTKIVTGDSIDCAAAAHVASGLGYRFDSRLCILNGYQPWESDPAFDALRWRNIGAPWKMYEELDANDAPQSELANLFAQIGGISTVELDCLTENVPGNKTVAAVFSGLAAFDVDPSTNGIGVTGELHRLCNEALVERVDPTTALNQRLSIRSVRWTNGPATFIAGPEEIAGPRIVCGGGDEGETQPCCGYIDPRTETSNGVDLDMGLQRTRLRFDQPIFKCDGSDVDVSAFAITETGGAVAPTITGVSSIDGDRAYVEVTWDRPITLQEWTTIIAIDICNADGVPTPSNGDLGPGVNEPDRVDYGFLPGDIDQSSCVTPFDLLRFRQIINGVIIPHCEVHFFIDVNRNGSVDPFDLLVFRQLVNGVGPIVTQPWAGECMNNPQP